MKIAISATGKNEDSLLNMRFGRCEYFQICDTENTNVKVIENEGMNSNAGAGISAANQMVDEGVNVIITGNLGPNAFAIIERAGMKAYRCGNVPVNSAIQKYKNGELQEITMCGAPHQGMGSSLGVNGKNR